MNMVGFFAAFSYLPLSYVDKSRFLLTEQFLYIWNQPFRDSHDRPLYGKQFCDMEFISVRTAVTLA